MIHQLETVIRASIGDPEFWLFVVFMFTWFFVRPLLSVIAGFKAKKKGEGNISVELLESAGLSIIIPCHNEERNIRNTVNEIKKQNLPIAYEIILVENNSTDRTREVCKKLSWQDPRIRVESIITPKGESAISHAMNHGLNVSRYPIFLRLDGDTRLADSSAVYKMIEPILVGKASATAGNVRIHQHKKNWLRRMQSIEYFFSMEVDRRSQQIYHSLLCASGAMQAFVKLDLIAVDGYHTDAGVSEDMDVTLKMHRRGKRVVMVDQAVSLTEPPDTIKALYKQRKWWMMLGILCLFIHRKGIGNRKYGHHGMIGFVGLPVKVFMSFQALVGLVIKFVSSLVMVMDGSGMNILDAFLIMNAVHVLLVWSAIAIATIYCPVKQGADCWYDVPLFSLFYQPFLAVVRFIGLIAACQHVIHSFRKKETPLLLREIRRKKGA